MKQKCMSLRFNLENEADRQAWDYLKCCEQNSKNRTVIAAINAFAEQGTSVADVIRTTIRDCFQKIYVMAEKPIEPKSDISEEGSSLLDSLDDFLGG